METEFSLPLYEEYEPQWRRRHRSLIPRRRRVTSFQEFFWISFWIVVAIGSAIFSAVHTIPAAEMTILADIPLRSELARSIFTMLELVIFGAAAMRHEIKWLLYLLGGALLVALIGNISSSVRAVAENDGDVLNQIGGVLMSVIAPFTALAAGEVLHIQLDKRTEKIRIADEEYDARCQEVEAMIRRDYAKLEREWKRAHQPVSRDDFMKSREAPRPRVKLHEVAREIHENGDVNLSAAEMMKKYNISMGSTTKVREILNGKRYINGQSDELAQ